MPTPLELYYEGNYAGKIFELEQFTYNGELFYTDGFWVSNELTHLM